MYLFTISIDFCNASINHSYMTVFKNVRAIIKWELLDEENFMLLQSLKKLLTEFYSIIICLYLFFFISILVLVKICTSEENKTDVHLIIPDQIDDFITRDLLMHSLSIWTLYSSIFTIGFVPQKLTQHTADWTWKCGTLTKSIDYKPSRNFTNEMTKASFNSFRAVWCSSASN